MFYRMSRNVRVNFSVLMFAGMLGITAAPAATTEETTTTSQEANLPLPAKAVFREGNSKNFVKRHYENLERAKEGPVGVLFTGDSITNGWFKVPEIWNSAFGKWNPANFGIGGDRTQNVLWRMENGELDNISPKVVVLMIGTNNTHSDSPEAIVLGIQRIIDLVQYKLPETKVLLLAVFPREPRMRDGELYTMPTEKVKEINKLLPSLAQEGRVRYLDIGDSFLGEDGKVPESIMPDGLHLSPEGYQKWADAIVPVLEEMMAE